MTRVEQLCTAAFSQAVEKACDAILSFGIFQPQCIIVLGSGLGPLAKQVENGYTIPYSDIPGFPVTHAKGHAGVLHLGYLAGVKVAMLQGRVHRYEGWSTADVIFALATVSSLGASTLITTNAAGGLNGRYRVGDLMAIDSHIDWLWSRGQPSCFRSKNSDQPLRGGELYDRGLLEQAKKIARTNDIVLHQGCYVATFGPTYETRSEYRMFREIGGDAVGMSTVPEVCLAGQLGLSTLAVSVITNVASTDVPLSTTHDEVVEAGNIAGPKLMKIISEILQGIAGQPD